MASPSFAHAGQDTQYEANRSEVVDVDRALEVVEAVIGQLD